MKFIGLLATGLLSASVVVAHPHVETRSELQRKSAMANKCAGAAEALTKKRMAQRNHQNAAQQQKKGSKHGSDIGVMETTHNANHPFYDTIQNNTCVLTPELTMGPYVWPRSQTLRQDMTEDQPGVPLWLDVGVLNMDTCEPFPNVMVNFWHCNATGSYSSFTQQDPNTKFVELLSELNVTNYTLGVTDLHTDDSTFLRGMWPTNDEGMMEMKTVFPGFYVERAIHIHTEVYTNWTLAENGTISSGNIASVGQVFFTEELEQQIMALEPYVSHTEINRTTNADDSLSIFTEAEAGGYNPIVSVVAADGKNVENGMIGYITLGVDPSASQTVG
ncbi:dioxygenase [Xylariaceae sp. FL0804]|nr:dioxygenase [Xylariaceae sp. FL0804]